MGNGFDSLARVSTSQGIEGVWAVSKVREDTNLGIKSNSAQSLNSISQNDGLIKHTWKNAG